ncbi:MAG: AraC family transcriptional regulator [Thermoflexibacter sp.]
MKPQFIRRNDRFFNESFAVKWYRLPHFERFWHYHTEMELAYNLKSTGTRFIGDSIAPFEEGEIILLGYNLPHVWLNDPQYFENREDLYTEGINLHFEKNILGNSFFVAEELKEIGQLIERASRGIIFLGESKKTVPSLLFEMLDAKDSFERLILLLKVLKILANETEYQYIASLGYPERFDTKDARMSKVFNYILHNFQSLITLNDVAEIAKMNKSAFCRYFKKVTNKHFVQYLNEVRISYACKLLLEQNAKSITDVCFASGYNNLSNFNQQFRKIKKISPSDFIQKYSVVFKA